MRSADAPNVEIRIPKQLAGNYTQLQKFIQGMSLAEFIDMFGWIFIPEFGEFRPWVLWPMQRELADIMDLARILWMPKARQMGGSEMVAMKIIKISIEENNAQSVIVSKGETEAKYFLKERFIKKLQPLVERSPGLPWPPVDDYTQVCYVGEPPETGKTDTRSYVESLPSDPDAGRGRTLRYIAMDEAKTIESPDKVFASLYGTMDANPRAQMVILSNSGNGTWFNERVNKLWEKCRNELGKDTGTLSDGNTLFFLSTYANPKHDAEWKRKSIAAFGNELQHYTENPETMEHFFLSPEGKVIPSFNKKEGATKKNEKGEMVGDTNVAYIKPDFTWRSIMSYDHGYQHPAVLTFALYNEYEDFLHIWKSIYWDQKYIDLIAIDIKNEMAAQRALGIPFPHRCIADGAIFNKTGAAARTIGEILRDDAGISFDRAHKYDESGALNLVNKRVRTRKLIIDPTCTRLIRDFDSWIYDKNGEPKDKDNDGPDTVRYIECELNVQERPKEAPKPKPYQRLAMQRRIAGARGLTQIMNMSQVDASRLWQNG